jgi:transcriptional regulator with XRE-family HTH domain
MDIETCREIIRLANIAKLPFDEFIWIGEMTRLTLEDRLEVIKFVTEKSNGRPARIVYTDPTVKKLTFAEKLRNARREKGWTQGQLAAAAGMQGSRVSHYETDFARPSMATAAKLAQALGLEPKDLQGEIHPDEAKPDLSTAGKMISHLRRQKGLTQKAFAELIGVSPNYVSMIETGAATASFDLDVRMADALGVERIELTPIFDD